jgi:hypothetical protein
MFGKFFNRDVYEIRWKNIVKLGTPHMTIWSMRIARWIPKATDTHSIYLILIAFSRQQWLRERALVLRYTYNACLANSHFLQCKNGMDFDGGNDSTITHHTYIM